MSELPSDDELNVRGILSQSGRNEGVFSVADRIVGLFSERLAELERLQAENTELKTSLTSAQDRNMQFLRERRDPRLRWRTNPKWEYATQLKNDDGSWKFQHRGLTRVQAELPPADPLVEWRMVRRLLGSWESDELQPNPTNTSDEARTTNEKE